MAVIPHHTYQCISCRRQYDPRDGIFTCPDCGPVKGTFDVIYDDVEQNSRTGFDHWLLRDQVGHWRYRKLLPIPLDQPVLDIMVGSTPLFRARRLEKHYGCTGIIIKDDTRNPSGSLKDRASSVAVCHAQWLGYSNLTTASTGNAGITLAFWAAASRMHAHVFVPRRVSNTALTMLGVFGARVYRVRGNYDQAFDQCSRAVERFGWYSRNTGANPVLGEGKKTVALEIAEAMADHPPDAVIVAVGDGCIFGGLWKGFSDAKKMGWISKIPRLYGIQSSGADPLARAFNQGKDIVEPLQPNTVADSIAVGNPRDAAKALRAARLSHGGLIAVPDKAILEAMVELAREVPIFVEPASASPLAGLKALLDSGDIRKSESVVLIMTGTGMKDIESARHAVATTPLDIGTSAEDLDHLDNN
jgi:threonine synthase